MEIHINECFISNDDKRFFLIKINDEYFEKVEGIKLDEEKCENCKSRKKNGCRRSNVIRRFDCKRKLEKLLSVYYVFTAVIATAISLIIYNKLELGFLTEIGIILSLLVVLDMICVFIESTVPKIYDKRFYKKLKKAKKKQEKIDEIKRKEKEEQKQKEEAEKIANSPGYRKILAAESMVNELRALSNKYDFGPNEENINTCVKKIDNIVKELKDNMDASSYGRVIYLFEVYLPAFYDTLNFYTGFIKTNTVKEEHKAILTESVNDTLVALEKMSIKAIFDSETNEVQFKAAAKALRQMLKEDFK